MRCAHRSVPHDARATAARLCRGAARAVPRFTMRRARDGARGLAMLAIFAAAGIAYTELFGLGRWGVGALYGVCIGGPVFAFQRGLVLPRLERRLRAASTPVYVAGTIAVFLILILLGNGFAGLLAWSAGLVEADLAALLRPGAGEVVYGLLVTAAVTFFFRMRDLVGRETFANLLIGRYAKPVAEERVFLFVDLVGSTRLAQELGDLRAQAFLGRFFAALAEPVRAARGSIDDYVGDMALITWPLARGVAEARCIRCLVDFAARLAAEAPAWVAEFGEAPRFRAVLHCGPVVTAELGRDKHKIVFTGDAVNTTARLEALGKALRAPVLISGDLLAALALPTGVRATPLGPHSLAGRREPLDVARLEWDGVVGPAGFEPATRPL